VLQLKENRESPTGEGAKGVTIDFDDGDLGAGRGEIRQS
jgi:hypothetical protein